MQHVEIGSIPVALVLGIGVKVHACPVSPVLCDMVQITISSASIFLSIKWSTEYARSMVHRDCFGRMRQWTGNEYKPWAVVSNGQGAVLLYSESGSCFQASLLDTRTQ